MSRIPILRNSYLIAYLRAARQLGVDPSPILDRFSIPRDFELIPDYVVPARPLHNVICALACKRSEGRVSVSAGLVHAIEQVNPFSEHLTSSVTLLDAIQRHNANVERYSSVNRFEIATAGELSRWFKCERSPLSETEAFCVANLIGHLRLVLGGDWRPPKVEVSVIDPSRLAALSELSGVAISRVGEGTSVYVPTLVLATPINKSGAMSSPSAADRHSLAVEFVESIRLIIRSYARVGALEIETVAHAVGLSRRTLQRRLGEYGLTFSELVDQARFTLAQEMLDRRSDLNITQIGYELGYRDPGSFTRAFKRFSGVAPVEYRRSLGCYSHSAA